MKKTKIGGSEMDKDMEVKWVDMVTSKEGMIITGWYRYTDEEIKDMAENWGASIDTEYKSLRPIVERCTAMLPDSKTPRQCELGEGHEGTHQVSTMTPHRGENWITWWDPIDI